MDLRLLTSFLAVARERSFSRAARKINLAQPTVSQQIQDLERELGTRLFLRRAKQVTLTEAGRILEPRAARVLAAAEDARHAVQELHGLTRGSLLIGAGTTPGVYVLPRVIADFQGRYPGVELTLRIANSRMIEEEIRAERLDIGVVGGHVLGPGERCVACVSPYAVAGEVRARQLAALRVSGLRIRRHFHVIHGEQRELSASARAFLPLLERSAARPTLR